MSTVTYRQNHLERQEQLKKAEAEQQEERRHQYVSSDRYSDYPGFNAYGVTLRKEDPDLFDMVVGAIRFFTK